MSLVIPTPLPAEADLVPCSYAVDITEGDPQEHEHVFYAAPDGSLTVAVWAAQPYAENIEGYPGDEFAHVVKGKLRLTDTDGTSQTFGEGDSYVMKAGWSGEFRVETPFMKYFALAVAPGGAQ